MFLNPQCRSAFQPSPTVWSWAFTWRSFFMSNDRNEFPQQGGLVLPHIERNTQDIPWAGGSDCSNFFWSNGSLDISAEVVPPPLQIQIRGRRSIDGYFVKSKSKKHSLCLLKPSDDNHIFLLTKTGDRLHLGGSFSSQTAPKLPQSATVDHHCSWWGLYSRGSEEVEEGERVTGVEGKEGPP